MIQKNNPAIDVEELMKRVRADAARIRISGAIEDRRGEPRNQDDVRLAASLDRNREVLRQLEISARTNLPKSAWPKRLDPIAKLAPPAFKFFLRVFNYVFKQQREFNDSILIASREMIHMIVAQGEYLTKTAEYVRSIERYRIESLRDIRESIAQLNERLVGLEHAHHVTYQAAQGAAEGVNRTVGEAAAMSAALTARIGDLEAARQAAAARLEHEAARVNGLEQLSQMLSDRIAALPTRELMRIQVQDELRELERRLAAATESAMRADALLRGELAELRRVPNKSAYAPIETSTVVATGRSYDAVHAALADRFRGDRHEIGRRLERYVDRVRAVERIGPEAPVFDIGAGRGEWLELLASAGIAAKGIETNVLLADECRVQGLDVAVGDGIAALSKFPAASLGAVTAFHVVEHLPFEALMRLLEEARRVIVPGGILILETPNPKNIVVGSQTFYLDPTHRNPVPQELLTALAELTGFQTIEIVPLEAPEPVFHGEGPTDATLNGYFSAPADYAIIAS